MFGWFKKKDKKIGSWPPEPVIKTIEPQPPNLPDGYRFRVRRTNSYSYGYDMYLSVELFNGGVWREVDYKFIYLGDDPKRSIILGMNAMWRKYDKDRKREEIITSLVGVYPPKKFEEPK